MIVCLSLHDTFIYFSCKQIFTKYLAKVKHHIWHRDVQDQDGSGKDRAKWTDLRYI